MPRAPVTFEKDSAERGYRVSCGKHYHMTRVFIWGEFDDGTISWQAARAHALRYARDWSRASRRPLVNLTPKRKKEPARL